MTQSYEGTTDATRCNDNHLQDGGPMGTEVLEPTHGGEPYWPEIGPKGFVTPLATVASTHQEAVELQSMWQQWLDARPARKTKKR